MGQNEKNVILIGSSQNNGSGIQMEDLSYTKLFGEFRYEIIIIYHMPNL